MRAPAEAVEAPAGSAPSAARVAPPRASRGQENPAGERSPIGASPDLEAVICALVYCRGDRMTAIRDAAREVQGLVALGRVPFAHGRSRLISAAGWSTRPRERSAILDALEAEWPQARWRSRRDI